ncbi:MAG: hypothetical protein AVDCRST_MAG02-4012, partial [uncultured Rubrobacteraceae bacterium]
GGSHLQRPGPRQRATLAGGERGRGGPPARAHGAQRRRGARRARDQSRASPRPSGEGGDDRGVRPGARHEPQARYGAPPALRPRRQDLHLTGVRDRCRRQRRDPRPLREPDHRLPGLRSAAFRVRRTYRGPPRSGAGDEGRL